MTTCHHGDGNCFTIMTCHTSRITPQDRAQSSLFNLLELIQSQNLIVLEALLDGRECYTQAVIRLQHAVGEPTVYNGALRVVLLLSNQQKGRELQHDFRVSLLARHIKIYICVCIICIVCVP